MKRVVINIRASKNISGLVQFSVTSPAGLMKFFLNVEPWGFSQGLSQDLETGCPKLAIVKFLGVQVFKGNHNILRLQPAGFDLTLPMLRLPSSKAHEMQIFLKTI